jgi:hypothetical protein
MLDSDKVLALARQHSVWILQQISNTGAGALTCWQWDVTECEDSGEREIGFSCPIEVFV